MCLVPPRTAFPFLRGSGQLGEMIEGFDWSRTGVGPLESWPPHMTAVTAMMLRSVVPIVMLWGDAGAERPRPGAHAG